MSKSVKISLLVTGTIMLLLPLLFYFIHFRHGILSSETETWGQFGDYLNGTFMPIIAVVGILVTFLLGAISEKRNESNVQIQQLKQRPILHIGYWDYEHLIRVFMINKGKGPLLIEEFKVIDITKKDIDLRGLFYGLSPLYNYFDNYTGNMNNFVLSPNEEVDLLTFEFNDKKIESFFESDIENIRNNLKKLKIVVHYSDVYNNKMPVYERSLEWFGRQDFKGKKNSKKD